MEEAGIVDAEIFASVTRGDNTNIVSARIAKEHYNVPNVAALIYDPRRAQMYERLGISTVATVAWATDQILARVFPRSKSVEWTIGSGEVVVIGFPSPNEFHRPAGGGASGPRKGPRGRPDPVRDTKIPDLKTIIQEGDIIHLAVARSSLPEMEERLGFNLTGHAGGAE